MFVAKNPDGSITVCKYSAPKPIYRYTSKFYEIEPIISSVVNFPYESFYEKELVYYDSVYGCNDYFDDKSWIEKLPEVINLKPSDGPIEIYFHYETIFEKISKYIKKLLK